MQIHNLLEVRGVSKRFPGVEALRNVHLEIRPKEVHALLGENGAGKSTLIKIIAGAYQADTGHIYYKGKETNFQNPQQASERGIAVIYQELSLFPHLDIAENLFVGRMRTKRGRIQWPALYEESQAILSQMDVSLDVRKPVKDLSVAEQQMVEIGRALSKNVELLIMDEPTSALSPAQVTRLFALMRTLKESGRGIIYITHRLEEVMQIADRVTILRDGKYIGTWSIAEVDVPQLITFMVGQAVSTSDAGVSTAQQPRADRCRLEVRELTRKGVLDQIHLTVRAGEIVGVGGLVGSGRTALCRALFGLDTIDAGEVFIDGKKCTICNPRDAIRAGMGYVPEDRKGQGLALGLSVQENITVTLFNQEEGRWLLDHKRGLRVAQQFVEQLKIAIVNLRQAVQYLSGGNQQKVVLAKWLATAPKLLIVDEPTRGIDVGAKAQVHRILRRLAHQGVGILLVSSENQELLENTDRIVVMREGRVVKEWKTAEATNDAILYYAAKGEAYR